MNEEINTKDNLEMKFQLPFQYLREITDNFSPDRELGRGGFGVVYKGIDIKSGAVIAVKRLKPILGEQDKQFKNEVNHLARLDHNNIVKLIGYCDETKVRPVYDDYQQKYILAEMQEKLLCYEHLSNGSIDNIIFNESLGLDWQERYKIVIGICQGLYYLHEGMDNNPIIHMDLKPSNILLGERMVPKIADFGLSRLFSEEQTRTCTMNLMGSIGYMAPEYCLRGEISTKSDIYSLGILILEVVTGQKNRQVTINKSGEHFIENVRENWSDMSQIASKHPSLGTKCLQLVHRCIEIGLSCVEADQERRPSAYQILMHMLFGECTYKVYQAHQASTFSGQCTEISSNSWIEFDMIINRTSTSRTSRLISMFTFSAAKGSKISIMAFEVANAIVMGSILLKILSEKNMMPLKEKVLRSKGVYRLISGDYSQLVVLVEADIREELSKFATEVVRFGNRCKDYKWHNLDQYFNRLHSDLVPQKISKEAIVPNVQYLIKLAQCTTELHREMLLLDKFQKNYHRLSHFECHCERNQDETGRPDRERNAVHTVVKRQRNVVKNLKKKTLWCNTMDDILEKLVDMVHFIHLEINNAFLKNHGVQAIMPESNLHRMLGPMGLALHYANVILQINALALTSSPSAIPDKARDALYRALPYYIRSKLREHKPREKVMMVPQVRAEMNRILEWLVPVAESTRLYYKDGAFGEWAMKGMEDVDADGAHLSRQEEHPITVSAMLTHQHAKINKIETLYYADKEKTEGYILVLIRALHRLAVPDTTTDLADLKSSSYVIKRGGRSGAPKCQEPHERRNTRIHVAPPQASPRIYSRRALSCGGMRQRQCIMRCASCRF